MEGRRPQSDHCVRNAVQRVQASGRKGIATTNYKNCGRKKMLTPEQQKMVVDYVKKWRKKLFCTCPHIRRELKLECSNMTVARTLNRHGYHWRQVPHKGPIKAEHIQKRKVFVDKHLHHRASWWVDNMHLVFDGVTLTKAPKQLSLRQKHAAQSIKALWMKKSEAMDPDLHTHNRHSPLTAKKRLATEICLLALWVVIMI